MILDGSFSSTRAIYSCIPLKAIQYYIDTLIVRIMTLCMFIVLYIVLSSDLHGLAIANQNQASRQNTVSVFHT